MVPKEPAHRGARLAPRAPTLRSPAPRVLTLRVLTPRALALRALTPLAVLAALLIATPPAAGAFAHASHVRTQVRMQHARLHRLASRLAPADSARAMHAARARHRRRGRHGHAASKKGHGKRHKKLLVLVDLTHLRKRGAIEPADARRWRAEYLAALHSLRALSGTRHTELAGVLGNLRSIAAGKDLTPSRAPSLFLTLQRNREWWTKDSLLSYGQRVSFPGSRLVWEYYPGQGIELQWLATFGEANGYYLSGKEDGALKQVLEEALSLASNRAGGISWDYLFHFDGGTPPWTSGLSQGTALQAFARAGKRLNEPRLTQAAEEALGIFQVPPPEGVLSTSGGPGAVEGGVEYLEYSYAPDEHIINGFIQALNGLYDYTKLTQSTLGQRLFEEGDVEARSEVPRYDTGAWSLYDQSSESDLGYHELLTEFLQNLCGRTKGGPPLRGEEASGTTEGGASGEAGEEGEGGTLTGAGGSEAPGSSSEPVAKAAIAPPEEAKREPIAGDEIYCSTAASFRSYLHTPPKIELLSHKAKRNARAGVMFSLSKVSTISLTVRQHGNGKVLWTNKATVEAGKPRLLWVTPGHGGTFDVSATAVDLAGNSETATGKIHIPSARRRKGKRTAHGKSRRSRAAHGTRR